MKNTIIVLLLLASFFTVTSCGQTEEEKIVEQVWEVMEQQNNIQNDMIDIAEKHSNWEISDEEYEKQINELEEWFDEMDKSIDNSIEKLSEDDFPSWALKQGLRKVNWLEFDENESEIIEKDSEAWFDWINVTYFWNDYQNIINEAEALAKDLDVIEIEMSPRKAMWSVEWMMGWMWITDEQIAEMQANMAENKWGAIFANCILWMTCSVEDKFAKMVSVEKNGEKWELNISIVNFEQWQAEMDKHNQDF